MNKKQTRLFVGVMILLMLGALGAGVYYWAEQHDYTYDDAVDWYQHSKAETTELVVIVNQTVLTDNTTTPATDAWMVKFNMDNFDQSPTVEAYGANFASQSENDTKTDGKYSLGINRSYVNSTHTYTCKIAIHDAEHKLLVEAEKNVNSNQISYYFCSKDYSLTTYYVLISMDEINSWVKVRVTDGLSDDMFT